MTVCILLTGIAIESQMMAWKIILRLTSRLVLVPDGTRGDKKGKKGQR